MKVVVGCEESQVICKAFHDFWERNNITGNKAYSCDIVPTRGDHPEWHIQCDILELLKPCHSSQITLGIFNPPCTYLCNSGVRWLYNKDGTRNEQRWNDMIAGANFFKALLYAPIPRIVIENPIMHRYAREEVGVNYGQLIQPYQFGNPNTKATGLWLKNVPPLKLDPSKLVPKEERIDTIHKMPPSDHRSRDRAVTFQEIAEAMATQWNFKV